MLTSHFLLYSFTAPVIPAGEALRSGRRPLAEQNKGLRPVLEETADSWEYKSCVQRNGFSKCADVLENRLESGIIRISIENLV